MLQQSRQHLTADAVYDEVRKILPHISKGTVYRNLRLLREKGEVSELDVCGTVSRFEARVEPHYHFRCDRCGRIFDLNEPVDHDVDRRVAEDTGFRVRGHYLEFRGLCRECQDELEPKYGDDELKEKDD